MKCESCDSKGYQESSIAKDATFQPMIIKCPNPNCPFEDKYYQMIRDTYSNNPKPFKLEEGEKIVPKRYSYDVFQQHLVDISKKYGDVSVDVEIPQEVMDMGDDKVLEYVKEHMDHKYGKSKENSDRINQTGPEPVRSGFSDGNEKMDPVYKNMPKALVKFAKETMLTDPSSGIILKTPFGPLVTRNLDSANRIMGIIKQYWKHEDELAFAEKQDNVIIFPLGRALGLEG